MQLQKQTRARWDNNEWDKVCLELYRRQPVAAMTNISLIKKSDIQSAMHEALPKERWRNTFNVTMIRPKLEERFKALRGQLQKIEQEQKDKVRLHEEAQKAAVKTRQRADVFAPLIDVMAERLFQRMIPMFEEYVELRMRGQPQEEAAAEATTVHEPKKRAIRVGVVGLLSIQEQEVKKHFSTYPLLDLTFYDKDKPAKGVKEWATNLDQVFGLVAKMSHGVDTTLRSMQNQTPYSRVDGRGTSSVIRSIEIWLASRD